MGDTDNNPPRGTCRTCGRPIILKGKAGKAGWYHEMGTRPPIGHYPTPSVVA